MSKYKIYNKVVAAILSFVFIFSGIFSLIVTADSSTNNKMCVVEHFNKLTQQLCENGADDYLPVAPNMGSSLYSGSCCFVAASMLLSFYDSYWSEQFVPYNLEWEQGTYNSSTDTLIKTFNSDPEAKAWEDYKGTGTVTNFAINNEDRFLQSRLISLCNELPIIDEFGVFDYQTQDILEKYLYEECGFTRNEITVNLQQAIFEEGVDDAIFATMKEQISKGNPVIFFGGITGDKVETDSIPLPLYGHAMIAFEVFTNSNGKEDIRLHKGYNTTNSFDSVKTTDFTKLNSIIWLEINEDALPHNCTDAYVDINTGETLCACEIYCGTHPNGSHTLGNVYSTYTSSNHERLCTKCGEGVTENHSLINSKYSGTQHIDYCACGYETVGSHSYTSYTKYSSTQHRSTCSCGYSKLSAHIIRDSSATIKTCIYCKAIVESGGGAIVGMALGNISYITENGSYIRPDGVIVISDIDYELLMNGELDIYALACDHDVE